MKKTYNIYLAGRYSRKSELGFYATALKDLGHNITADWLYEDEPDVPQSEITPKVRGEYAVKCIKGLTKSNMFVCFTDDASELYKEIEWQGINEDLLWEYTRGGRHVELGFCMAWGCDRIVFIGKRENIFHYIENMEQYDTFDAFVEHLDLSVELDPLEEAVAIG